MALVSQQGVSLQANWKKRKRIKKNNKKKKQRKVEDELTESSKIAKKYGFLG